jgi:glutamine synthetase
VGFIEPVNESKMTVLCESVGLRAASVAVFHNLSRTSIDFSTGTEEIDYFEYVESMFPAISALLKLADVDPDHMEDEVHAVLKEMLTKHKRILFNGNGYTDEWVEEAGRRGLANLVSLPDAMPHFITDKSIGLFTKYGIFTKEEIYSRYEILLENYAKTVHIEALTLMEMVRKDFTTGLVRYMKDVTTEALKKRDLLPGSKCSYESDILKTLDETSEQILLAMEALAADTAKAEGIEDILEQARFYHETVLAEMEALRSWTDKAEAIIPDEYLPYPTYEKMLFSLR